MDSIGEVEMFECENGHIISDEFVLGQLGRSERKYKMSQARTVIEMAKENFNRKGEIDSYYDSWRKNLKRSEELINFLTEIDKIEVENDGDWDEEEDDFRYALPEKYCAACQFLAPVERDLLDWYRRKYDLEDEHVIEILRDKFGSYKSFKEWLDET
jgi:hypothetical protein